MLHVLVGYIRGLGIDTRWVVIEGDPYFFAITKRIHNRIHGVPGDRGGLGPAEAGHFAHVAATNAAALRGRSGGGHRAVARSPDGGHGRPVARCRVRVVWRSHIGSDTANAWTDEAWAFLRPHLSGCDGFVFSRREYVPEWVPARMVSIIAPSIDPFSAKNQVLAGSDLPVFLARIGLTSGPVDGLATFRRGDGTMGQVTHRAAIVSEGGPLDVTADLVVQVSRWDRLKDMHGVMIGFASRVAGRGDAQLALVGPAVEGVADDPEGAEVLAECISAWEGLPAEARRRIRLCTLPTADIGENAAMVNALQRAGTVIVQKSLAEGFGLTVAEGMWKAKAVVASRVGGIIDQVVPDTGILLDDPADLDAFGDALASLLGRPDDVVRLGVNARRHVLQEFVGDRHLLNYAALIERLMAG